jgi:hypothetical protein
VIADLIRHIQKQSQEAENEDERHSLDCVGRVDSDQNEGDGMGRG